MSEDRTQAPSKRRRDEARARGIAARSPELTASVGLLAAVILVGLWGGSLATGMVDLVRAPMLATPSDPASAVALVRASAFRVFAPLVGILGGVVAAMVAAHQAQVGGLWAPVLLAPDLDRLWSPPGTGGGDRAVRGGWGVLKGAVVAIVAAWAIRSEFAAMATLGHMSVPDLVASATPLLKGLAYKLGLATLVLGVVDYAMARRRVEAMLRVTPDQHREDQKAVDGDPAVRSRRLRQARSWRADPSDLLAGASLIVTGPAGLAVVLGGEGPPGKVLVRGVARGASGTTLKKAAAKAGLPVVAAPALAVHFSGAEARNRALPEALAKDLAALWTAPTGTPPPPRAADGRVKVEVEEVSGGMLTPS